MRKLLSTVAAIAIAAGLAGTVAYTSTIPLLTGPGCAEAGAQLQCFNQIIQSINAGVTGNYAFLPGPVGNSGGGTTTANFTLASAIIPTGSLTSAGQGYRARCAGISTISTTVKFGIVVGRSMQVSLENNGINTIPANGANWDLELQWQAATTPVTANTVWMGRAFAGTATGSATNQVVVISGNDTTVTDNNTNLQLPVSCVVYGGINTGLATMMNFSVEQLR